ncbi:Hypp7474 [Branchiostoma lanceolatum]|uniref:Hypp7474 protein n=1 Tax=Branchiostoma lanceolatum TaxID=7740 RepID=A0A8K0EBV2_BRALA|nr:Hypp7474 [Branchiostoma lanceolatum]
MKVSTLSALLLTLVCCAMLAEVVTGGKGDLDSLKTKKDVIRYIKAADDQIAAAKDVYAKLVAMGKIKLAKRFQKRAKSYFKKLSRKGENNEDNE